MNNGLIIPETIFFSTLKSMLNLIRQDFNNAHSQTDTILYKAFAQAGSLDKYLFYDQLRALLITEKDDPRTFDFVLGFNSERSTLPTIHITLPSEQSAQNGLGLDTFDEDTIYDDVAQTYTRQITRRYDATYLFTITSNNMNDVITLYHFMKSILIQLIDHLELSNLEHVRISGSDIRLDQNITPGVYARNISISISYDITLQELFTNEYVNKLFFDQVPPTIAETEVDASDSGSA